MGPAKVASGFARGHQSPADLLQSAIAEAREKLSGQHITGALLLFSPTLAAISPAMLQQQMRALSCLQMATGTFPGIFTEKDQTLGENACAVLLLCAPLGLIPQAPQKNHATLAWGRLEHLQGDWLEQGPRFGSLSSRSGRFWYQASPRDSLELGFSGVSTESLWSAGLRTLSAPLPVHLQEGSLLLQLERYMALPLLAQNIPVSIRKDSRLPLEQLLVGEIRADALPDAPPEWLHIRATDLNRSGLWLERPLADNARAFLSLRDPAIAERDTRIVLDQAASDHKPPLFAWISSSIGRDAGFFGQDDRDLSIWREQYPDVPMLGAYGMGELFPRHQRAHFLRYSKIYTLFSGTAVEST
ncbi:histidine kinase [Acidithiobacillus montserratensis]|uniref:Histidine kinase n=1 Tax=Acidithiobacillus montserratensis TaxID=2729135 RepID=A0ACD5HF31_9PROT|nr:histidine kinase [Acidithiobacillaceae bacterium]MBU2749032.1 histidine kinase [Acidithiobacillus montserratensis]